jgi:hypothetical protein
MRVPVLPIALFMLAAAAPLQAKAVDEPAPITAEEQSGVRLALDRAQLLHRYDQAAWHTTDALLSDVPKAALATIRGWVVTPDGADYRVTYYSGEPGTEHRAVYSAVWTGGTGVHKRQLRAIDDNRLSAEEERLAAASDAVGEDGPLRCAEKRFNRVVLPRATADSADLVYLLTPQTETNSIPLGGHHRAEVKDRKVVSMRAFSKSCLNMPLEEKAEALAVSHLLDPTPTEIHFFSVFAAKKPIFVLTTSNDRTWVAESSGGQARVRVVK